MGALGILGGIGRGYIAGRQSAAALDEQDQRRQAGEIALQNARDEQEQRQAVKTELSKLPGMVEEEVSKRGIARKTAKEAKDSAEQAAYNFESASKAQPGPEVSPVTDAVVKAGEDANKLAFLSPTQIAAGVPAAGIQTGRKTTTVAPAEPAPAPAGVPPPAAAPPYAAAGIQPRVRGQTSLDTPVDSRDAYNMAWKQLAPRVAAVYQKYGKIGEAKQILESADSAELQSYTKAFNNTMRLIATGDDLAAASSIENLYNLGFPDGRVIDVKPLGNGQFEVQQLDDKGKVIQTATVDRKKLMEYSETFLSPAERAKLELQSKADATKERIAAARDASITERALIAERARGATDDARFRTTLAAITARGAAAGGKTTAADKKANDKRIAAASTKAKDLAGGKNYSPAALSEIAADATRIAKDDEDLTADEAAKEAYDNYTGKVKGAKTATDAHMAKLREGVTGWLSDSNIESMGDQDVVKAIKAAGKPVNAANYKAEYSAQQLKAGSTAGKAETAAKSAAPPKPSRADAVAQAKAALATPNLEPEKAAAIRARMKEWYPDVKL